MRYLEGTSVGSEEAGQGLKTLWDSPALRLVGNSIATGGSCLQILLFVVPRHFHSSRDGSGCGFRRSAAEGAAQMHRRHLRERSDYYRMVVLLAGVTVGTVTG